MKLLEDKIVKEGKILPGDILKVDGFLNHLMDVNLLSCLAKDIYEHYKHCDINKILTVESSGIGIACFTAQFFNCPLLVAKKSKSLNISNDVYSAQVFSYTHKSMNTVVVSKEYLHGTDNVLIVDDFLATGNACLALTDIIKQAGATLKGVSCAIEKTYQGGHLKLAALNTDVYSLARIKEMKDGVITFCE